MIAPVKNRDLGVPVCQALNNLRPMNVIPPMTTMRIRLMIPTQALNHHRNVLSASAVGCADLWSVGDEVDCLFVYGPATLVTIPRDGSSQRHAA